MAHATAHESPPHGQPTTSVLTIGAVLTFIGFLVTVLSAVLINALSPSVGALQVQQMQDALYVGLLIVVAGVIILLAGLSRPGSSKP